MCRQGSTCASTMEYMNNYITRKEVARILSVDVRTVDRYAKAGLLAHTYIPAGPRFTVEGVQQFILNSERARLEAVKAEVL